MTQNAPISIDSECKSSKSRLMIPKNIKRELKLNSPHTTLKQNSSNFIFPLFTLGETERISDELILRTKGSVNNVNNSTDTVNLSKSTVLKIKNKRSLSHSSSLFKKEILSKIDTTSETKNSLEKSYQFSLNHLKYRTEAILNMYSYLAKLK